MRARLSRPIVVIALAAASIAAVVGGTVAGAATAPAALPDAATVQRQAALPDLPENAPPPAQARPRLHSTMGVVIRVTDQRFAISTNSGRHVVGVRPITAIWVGKQRAALADLKPGDAVLVLGRTGPRGNYIARAVRVVRQAPTG